MKNLILFAILSFCSSSVFANDCLLGRCAQSVKKVSVKAANVTREVVSVPIRVTRNAVSGIQQRQSYRRYR
jgi:hypothetical protein